MKAKEYDIIVPVGLKDTGFVWKVVKYIRNCMPEAAHIYLITSRKNFKLLKKVKDEDYSILDENELIDGLTFQQTAQYLSEAHIKMRTGWYFQQFLKYGFALSKYAKKYYLSWDADTLPLAHIDFFNEANKPMFTMKTEYNPNYFKTIKKLLGIDKQTKGSFIAEHMLFSTDIVRELIEKISKSNVDGENWMQKIINACDASDPMPGFSEFETYGSYVLATHPDSYAMRHLNTFRYGGYIRGRQISEKMLKKISFDTDTMSFELGMNPAFPANIPNLWISTKMKFYKVHQMGFCSAFKRYIDIIKNRKASRETAKETEKLMSRT